MFVKRENVEFSKEMLSKFCKKPMFLFCYNHPNEVILIGKEP